MKNGDDKCFLWFVLRALNKSGKHDERIDNDLRSKESTVNMTGIEYPVTLSDIKKFEKNNPGIFINVFGFNSKEKIYPLFSLNRAMITMKTMKRIRSSIFYSSKRKGSNITV